MAGDILQTLIVRLKSEGVAKTEEDIGKVEKKTQRTAVVMRRVSKMWGLAFKAAGLFAVGLFASILKGGPVTTKFLSQTWRAIGHLGDTIIEKTGAWDMLSKVTDYIYDLNSAIREGDIMTLGDLIFNAVDKWSGVFARISTPIGAVMELFRKLLPDSVKEGMSKILDKMRETKTSISTVLGEWKVKIIERMIAIKNFINGIWNNIKQIIVGIIDSIKEKYDRLKAYLKPLSITHTITTIRNVISSVTGRQAGGAVTAGRPHIVGEAGPELFTPASSGAITPAHDIGGFGGGVIENHIRIDLDGRVVYEGIKRHMANDIRRRGG